MRWYLHVCAKCAQKPPEMAYRLKTLLVYGNTSYFKKVPDNAHGVSTLVICHRYFGRIKWGVNPTGYQPKTHPVIGFLDRKIPQNLTKSIFSARIQICDAVWSEVSVMHKNHSNDTSLQITGGIWYTCQLHNVLHIVHNIWTLLICHQYFGRIKWDVNPAGYQQKTHPVIGFWIEKYQKTWRNPSFRHEFKYAMQSGRKCQLCTKTI